MRKRRIVEVDKDGRLFIFVGHTLITSSFSFRRRFQDTRHGGYIAYTREAFKATMKFSYAKKKNS